MIKCKGPTPVAARSKAWVCDSPLAGIAGSNPTGALVRCQVQFSVTGWSLVQGSPTDCDRGTSEGRSRSTRSVQPWEKEGRAWCKYESTKKASKTGCLFNILFIGLRCAGNNTTGRPDKSWKLETPNLPPIMSLFGPELKVEEEGTENTVVSG